MKIKECCYNCRRSCGSDDPGMVYCFALQEQVDENYLCDEFAPESFTPDPYE